MSMYFAVFHRHESLDNRMACLCNATGFKCVRYDGESYVPWPESYNNDAMVYDLVELRLRKEGDRI